MSTQGTETRVPTLVKRGGLWRNRDFTLFWFGETLSLYGFQVTVLALPLAAVLTFHAGPTQVGYLRSAELVPYVLFAPLFGVLVDRSRKRPILIGTNLLRMLLILSVPALSVPHLLRLPMLYAVGFAVGTASVAFDLSWMSYIPLIVQDRRSLVAANARMSVTYASADVVGPGIAGALVSWLTAPLALLANAGAYAISVATLCLIKAREDRPGLAESQRSVRSELTAGLTWVTREPRLKWLALTGCVCNIVTFATQTLFLVFALDDVGVSPQSLGVVLGAGAFGGLFGAFFSPMMIRRCRLGLLFGCSVSIVLCSPLLIPAAIGTHTMRLGTMIVSLFLAQAGLSVSNVISISLRQALTPDRMLARMTAGMRMVMYGGGAVGSFAAGVVGGQLGPRYGLWCAGVLGAVLALLFTRSPVLSLRSIPEAV